MSKFDVMISVYTMAGEAKLAKLIRYQDSGGYSGCWVSLPSQYGPVELWCTLELETRRYIIGGAVLDAANAAERRRAAKAARS